MRLYREKVAQALRGEAQVTSMAQRSRLIDQAALWNRFADDLEARRPPPVIVAAPAVVDQAPPAATEPDRKPGFMKSFIAVILRRR